MKIDQLFKQVAGKQSSRGFCKSIWKMRKAKTFSPMLRVSSHTMVLRNTPTPQSMSRTFCAPWLLPWETPWTEELLLRQRGLHISIYAVCNESVSNILFSDFSHTFYFIEDDSNDQTSQCESAVKPVKKLIFFAK